LSRYGVPDDDMSDSLPPVWGLTPEEERDLEAVLSGKPGRAQPGQAGHPGPRQPAAAVLAGLRAAPVPGELDGEAAARTAYRLFVLPAGGWPAAAGGAASAPAAPVPPAWPAGNGPRPLSRPGPRHRRPRRRVPWPGRRPGAALLGAAVVAALLVALVCVLVLPWGSLGHPGPRASAAQAVFKSNGSTAKQAEPLGSGTKVASPRPTAARSGTADPSAGPGRGSKQEALCQQYLASLEHPAAWRADNRLARQLSRAAGGLLNVQGFCAALGSRPAGGGPPWSQPQTAAPQPGAGDTPAGNGLSGDQGGLEQRPGAASRGQR
jgi:hypothetical protein